MHHYLRMVTKLETPLNMCTKEEYRQQSKFSSKLYESKVSQTLRNLTKVVERKIGKAMKEAKKGAIMSDAWTKFGYHYLCLLAVFVHRGTVCTVMLACSPLPGGRVDDDAPEDESEDERRERERKDGVRILVLEGEDACVFNKAKHVEFFENSFQYYLPDLENISDWAVVHIADNHPINQAISKILGIYDVGCYNHRLNLDVKEALTFRDADHHKGENPNNVWIGCIANANQTMKDCKIQMKGRSVLRSQTHLVPKIGIDQRWSGTFDMIGRHNRIYDKLLYTHNHKDTNVRMDTSETQQVTMVDLQKILKPLAIATKNIQEKHFTLSQSDNTIVVTEQVLAQIMDTVLADHDEDFVLDLGRCQLSNDNKRFVGSRANFHFQTGVIKIQERKHQFLDDNEKRECEKLLKENNNTVVQQDNDNEDDEDALLERINAAAERQRAEDVDPYINCDFVLGSSAEVERVWSMCTRILSMARAGMFPVTLEAIIYLKYNHEWWGMADVQEAIEMRDEDELIGVNSDSDDSDDDDDEDDDDEDDDDDDDDE